MRILFVAILIASMSNLSFAQWDLTGNGTTNPPINL